MVTRIIHLSDLHFPSRDHNVANILKETVRRHQPRVVVVTGDIANHPSLSCLVGRGPWCTTRAWLDELVSDNVEKVTLLVLPGNHDVLVSGVSGWCSISSMLFRRAFRGCHCGDVLYMPDANITFLALDTNPIAAVFSAEGKAVKRRIKRLQRALHEHERATDIRASTKILLIHHHPLPVPFETDMLLSTRRVDRLLRFMAEEKIDLVLHGHKHRASWSHLRIGGTSEEPYFLEALGAGSAMKRNDHDRRGHNFNLIDVAPNGVRQIRQFFKLGGQSDFTEAKHSPAEDAVARLAQFQFRQPYRARRLTWRVEVDRFGDAMNSLSYDDLVFNQERPVYEVPLLEDEVEAGAILPYDHLVVDPHTLDGSLVTKEIDGRPLTVIRFRQRPTETTPATVRVENYTLDSYAMDQQEAAAQGRKDPRRDYLDLTLSDPVNELCLEATFPQDFVFANPRLDVYEPFDSSDTPNQMWTRELTNGNPLKAERNHLTLTLRQPPPNFRYHVSWDLPAGSDVGPAAISRRTVFERRCLALLDSDPSPETLAMEDAIISTFQDLSSALEGFITRAISSVDLLRLFGPQSDFSVMVPQTEADGIPRLRLVYWSLEDSHRDAFLNCRLAIGEGNAGRAYKTRMLRLYDRTRAQDDPRTNTFKEIEGMPHYTVVLSVPLIDSRSLLPLAVLNVATTNEHEAQLMRTLTTANLTELTKVVHAAPRDRLLRAANLQV